MISYALAADTSCYTTSRARCTGNSQSPCADMTRGPAQRETGATGPSGSAGAAAATGELPRMLGPRHSDSAERKGSSGSREEPLPVGLPFSPCPCRPTEAGVSVPTLPGQRRNVEKWISP